MNDKLILSPIPLEDLETAIARIVRQEIANYQAPAPSGDELINTEEVAKLFDVSLGTVRNWRRRGLIQAYKIGTRVRFKRSELMEALGNHSKYRRSIK